MGFNQQWQDWLYSFISATNPYQAFVDLVNANKDDPSFQGFLTYLSNTKKDLFDKFWNYYVSNGVANGDIGANDAYAMYGSYNTGMPEETSKYLDNLISQENTASDREFQTEMRDTSLTSAGDQLSQLGLSPSNVISVGGASSGLSSAAAEVSHAGTSANRRQQLAMNQYNQRMGMAKSLIGMAGSMASSGIYGSALGAAKHSASAMASAASHSGLMALKTLSGKSYYDVLQGLNDKF